MKNTDMLIIKNNQGIFQQRYEVISNYAVVFENSSSFLPSIFSIYFPLFRHMGKNNNIDITIKLYQFIFGLRKSFRSYTLTWNFGIMV